MPAISRFFGLTVYLYFIEIHRHELLADWKLAASGKTPFKIPPLR